MSDEGWVMPTEACKTTPRRRTGKGALGKRRAMRRDIVWALNQVTMTNSGGCRARDITTDLSGECERALNLTRVFFGKVPWG